MIVVFNSSETGELMIMADLARVLLKAISKECTAKGVIMQYEMDEAVSRLEALSTGEVEVQNSAEPDGKEEAKPTLGARVWPLLDMLKRTAAAGPKTYVMWQAPAAFGD